MENSTTLLDQILYHSERPWLEENLMDVKFAPKLYEIQEIMPDLPLHYKIEFMRPFDSKTKYYQRLIQNAVVNDVSNILSHIREQDDKFITYYLLNDILDKKMTTRLKYIGELLQDKDYSLTYLGRNYIPSVEEKPHQANTFIMQLLKLAYMQVYLEIQEEYRRFRNDILIPEDFYSKYLAEPIPQQIPIQKLTLLEVESYPTKEKTKVKPKNLTDSPSFRYKQFEKHNDKITNLWDNLKRNHFISEDTSIANFKRVFSGKKIITPVVWTGNRSELYYFIKLIYSHYQLVEDVGQRNWEITCNCFVQKDGSPFDRSKFKDTKTPKLTKHKIEYAVSFLN